MPLGCVVVVVRYRVPPEGNGGDMTNRGETTRQLQTYENSRYIIVHGAKGDVWGMGMGLFGGSLH